MKPHTLVIIGLLLVASASHAVTPSPEQAVEILTHANHGLTEMSGQIVMETWEEVRQNPKPYIPALKEQMSLARLEATTASYELNPILNAATLLMTVGGSEERDFLVSFMKNLQQKRDEVSTKLKSQRPRRGAVSTSKEDKALQALTWQHVRLSQLETTILNGFKRASDPRLRDLLLARMDREEVMLEGYLDYFTATCREDPLVRARLEKLVIPPNFGTERRSLQRFFAK